MKRIIFGYIGSFVIIMLFFKIVYSAIFESYGGGGLEELAWTSKVMDLVFYPIMNKILLFHLGFFAVILLPIIGCSSKFLKEKKLWSFLAFVLGGVIVAAVTLVSIEPIIATDMFEYGERQEYNKVLEAIGYTYINAMTYSCIVLMSLFTWSVTQLNVKDAQS